MRISTRKVLGTFLLGVAAVAMLGWEDPSGQVLNISWMKSNPLPEPRADYAAGLLAGRLVLAGGTYWEGSKDHWIRKMYSASVHAFDPANSSWEKLPDLPVPLGDVASTVVGNRLFVLGGFGPSGPNRKIFTLNKDPNHWQWSTFSELSDDRLFSRGISLGERLYVLGGLSKFEPYDRAGTCCTSNSATNTLMMLDTVHPQRGWKQLPPFPASKRWLFAVETDGASLWLFGGLFQGRAEDPITMYGDVLRFDVARGKWSAGPALPEAARAESPLSSFRANGKIVLVGKNGKVWQFDPQHGQYAELEPLPEQAMVDKFVCSGDLIMGSGGENNLQGPRRRSEWTFVGKLKPVITAQKPI